MKALFDTRPLKEEAWMKCKDSLDSIQMSGLEAIVDGKSLPNGYRRVNLEQVIRFMIIELKWRQEKSWTKQRYDFCMYTKGLFLHLASDSGDVR